MEPETLFVTDFLMFVGAGSASTGGGIKVTTLAVLALMVWAELRGDPHVNAFSPARSGACAAPGVHASRRSL